MSFKNPPSSGSSEASVLKVEHSQPATGSVGVGMYPSLMGTFSCPAPVLMIGSSFDGASTSTRSVPFCTSHMGDPWILPSPSPSSEAIETSVPLPAVMIAYQANLQSAAEPCSSSSQREEEYPYVLPAWAVQSSHAHDCLDMVFPSDEVIIEARLGVEPPWEEFHHRSDFVSELDRLESEEIPSLKLAVELLPDTSPLEEHLVHLEQLDEQRRDALVTLEVNKRRVKAQYDKSVRPRVFSEGDLVLLWDQSKEPLGVGKFNPMWCGPYVVKRVLEKGSYELVDYEGTALAEPRNGLYLKKYYA